VVTHGHGDHFFGGAVVLDAFAGAALIAASAQVIDEAREQTEPGVLQNWTVWFGDEYDHNPPIRALMDVTTIDLEGHTIAVLPVGGADGVLATVVHLPELDTICSGDALYNDIHMSLWNSTPASRASWLETIDAIAAMQPATIIAGHRDPDAPDDDARRLLAQSWCYIEAFDLAMTRVSTAGDLIDAMMADYGNFRNPDTLFLAAHSQFPQ
jgi:glyoxylase-like metal-dependent hydrolase (beta-lactamase superfamily II)